VGANWNCKGGREDDHTSQRDGEQRAVPLVWFRPPSKANWLGDAVHPLYLSVRPSVHGREGQSGNLCDSVTKKNEEKKHQNAEPLPMRDGFDR